MSTEYYIFAEARYNGKWYSINPIVKKADGTYHMKMVFWATSGFREMYYNMEDWATERGIPDDLSAEMRSRYHENLDDVYADLGSQITYRKYYRSKILVVPYNKLKPHIVKDRPYKHMGYVFRECIPDFECGETDDIEHWLTIDEYKALPEEEKKSYAYYEWNNRWDEYDYKRDIVAKISFLTNLFSEGDSVDGDCGWIDVADSDIRLIVEIDI